MKLIDLIEHCARRLRVERDGASARGLDTPITASVGRLVSTAGTLHLYRFDVPADAPLEEDLPVTIIPPGDVEPTEGFVVGRLEQAVLIQTFDAFGQTVNSPTIVPDTTAFLDTASKRLTEMAHKSEAYTLGPAERLLPWLDPELSPHGQAAQVSASTSVLTTVWNEDPLVRRARLASLAIELVRSNKRILLVSPDHRRADEALGTVARALRGAGLSFKSLVSRYEMPVQREAAGLPLSELGFEGQMHQFYSRSRADKATLRRKYDRFRELTPLLAYKTQKQQELDEVKHLEWRLLTQLSELQGKIKEVSTTLAEYEGLPIWKRLAMQTLGKNTVSLVEYRAIYEKTVQGLLQELEVAKRRIQALSQEAAIPKELRPEYNELKEEINRLGGSKRIRELLAAEEGTNRQAFIQNKRMVITTAARVVSDPLFGKVQFDVLMADEAPLIPAPFLLAASGLVRERIVLSGDTRDIFVVRVWESCGALPFHRHTTHSSSKVG
ncbi:MAG TPA: hypothetical protein VFL31_00495 [Nitrospiraceae bacterium]|nr:hypothetical protein [Nitrospiraceae bacterium]